MPPKGKRKAPRENQKSKKPKTDRSSQTLQKLDEISKPFSVRKCKLWFQQYADEPDLIGPDGIQKLCSDLQLDPEDIVMLVVAWKLNAENLGFFKYSEWCTGMGSLECDSTRKLQSKLKSLKNLISDPVVFKKMYRFAFDFCRNKDQRNLDIDVAIEMLKILLSDSWNLLDPFIEFIRQSDYKVINKDQWCNVLEFNRTVKSDLSNYDVDGAFISGMLSCSSPTTRNVVMARGPVMLDEFVEWFNKRK